MDDQSQKQNLKPLEEMASVVDGHEAKLKWFRARNARRRQRIIAAGHESIEAERERARIEAAKWRAKKKGEQLGSPLALKIKYLKARLSDVTYAHLRKKLNWAEIISKRRFGVFEFANAPMCWPLNPSLIWFGAIIAAVNAWAVTEFQSRHIYNLLHYDPDKARRLNERNKQARSASYQRRLANPETARVIREADARQFKKHKARIYEYRRNRPESAKQQLRDYYTKWHRDRRRNDPQYNIRNRLASRLWHAVASQNGKKAHKTVELIGCSVSEFRDHIESLFTDGMSWDCFMRGEIHLDHIIPCARFNLADPDEQKRCFHFSNLQPLWAEDNLSKGDSLLTLSQTLL